MRINHLLGIALSSAIVFAAPSQAATSSEITFDALQQSPQGQLFARRGADDGPNHDVGDDHGRRGGRRFSDDVNSTANQLARRGADDGPNHDIGDDRGRRGGGRGADDGPNHDIGDDHGRHRGRNRG